MANNQPKITFKVFNQEFNKAMTEMNNEGKKFRQELKLEQEQLKMTGSESDKLAADLNGLQKQYDVAQQKTKATADQLEKAKVVFGENSTEVATMETKLRSAEIAEQQLANKIGVTTQKLDEAKAAEKSRVSSIRDLEDTQKNLEAQTEKLSSEFKLEQQAMAETATEAEKLAHAEKYVADQTELAEKKIENMERQLELTKQEYGENSTEALRMETALNQAKGGVSKLENELDELKTSSNSADDGMEQLNKTLSGGMMIAAAEKLAELGEKLKEVAQFSLDAFREVDDGLDTVISKTGVTGSAADSLTNSFNSIFGETVFESQAVGDAIGEVNTQFGQTDKKLEETSLAFLKFADINGSDVTTSVMSAKQAMEAYRLSNEDIPMILDATTSASQKTGQSTDDLMKAAIGAAPQMDALNLSYEEGVLLLGQMSQSGLDETKTMAALNKATGYYAKNNKSLSQGLGELQGKIKGAKTEQEGIAAATEVFGAKTGPAMARAVRDNIINLEDLATTSEDSKGTVSRTFAEMEDPIDMLTTASKGLIKAMSKIGAEIAATLAPLLEKLGDIMKGVSKWFDGLSQTSKDVIVILGLLSVAVAAILPMIVTFFVAISAGAASAGVSMGAFMLSLLPVIGVVVAIMAVITAVILVIKNWGAVTEWLGGVWESIKVIATNVWNGIANFFITIWTTITAFLTTAWQGVVNVATTIWNGLVNVFTFIFLLVKTVIMAQWTIISTALTFAWKALVAIVGFIFKPVIDMFRRIWEGVKTVVMAVWNFLSPWLAAIWNKIKSLASGVFNAVAGVIRNIWNGIKSVTTSVWNAVSGFIVNVWNKIKSAISTAINATKSVISNVWNTIKSVTSSVWNSIKSVISSVWNGIKSAVTGPINTIKSTVSSVWNSIKSITSSTFNAVKNAIMTPINAAKDGIKRAIDAIKGFFSGLKLKFPKIDMPKLPHFSLDGKFSLKPPSVPKLSVDWHANGGFFNQASVIGIGEKGPEAAVPLMGRRMDPFADAVGNRIFSNLPAMAENKLAQAGDTNVTINMTNNLYGAADENRLVDKITQGITKNTNTKTTAWGGRA
ncbi:tail tape measure protein [Listeria booriae]|uniref:phage tail tape measure protein n=1 Tax=Listeria booriae TaxID=1552123 RepID=UPI001626BD1F|nr:phage tail tape measure protein [Listeria booriae]MBC1524790.1 tail tape measure protein [Listeria booriae]